MSQLRGVLRQKTKNGPYYYRLQVTDGVRKEFSLKTCDFEEACRKAAELDSVWEAPNKEVAFAQINAIKGFTKQTSQIPLSEIWDLYDQSPDKATPQIKEQIFYRSTLNEFIAFASGETEFTCRKSQPIKTLDQLNSLLVQDFTNYLKTTRIAVDTHNRKMKRLRKIFSCLTDYYFGPNPFQTKIIFRYANEEQDYVVRRQPFTQEQEQQLRDVLADTVHRVMNKPEIRCIYYLGMYTGQRLKDCVLLQWQNIDLRQKLIFVKQFKTGKEVTIPIAPQLLAVLLEAQAWRINQYVCPKTAARYKKTDAAGKNVGNNHVNIDVLRVIRWIGLEPSVSVYGRNKKMTVYGFHSLRHSFCSFCAEAGVPKAVLLSILGTESDIADKYYTHVGDAAQRQAIEAISMNRGTKTPQDKINEALALLNQRPDVPPDLAVELKRILS